MIWSHHSSLDIPCLPCLTPMFPIFANDQSPFQCWNHHQPPGWPGTNVSLACTWLPCSPLSWPIYWESPSSCRPCPTWPWENHRSHWDHFGLKKLFVVLGIHLIQHHRFNGISTDFNGQPVQPALSSTHPAASWGSNSSSGAAPGGWSPHQWYPSRWRWPLHWAASAAASYPRSADSPPPRPKDTRRDGAAGGNVRPRYLATQGTSVELGG